MHSTGFGISHISLYQPEQVIANDWYGDSLPKKFVNHTGIEERHISFEDEVSMASKCIEGLSGQNDIDLEDCAGLVFVTPSFVPMHIANRYMNREQARREQPTRAAYALAEKLGLSARKIIGMNGFCSGYAKACLYAKQKMIPTLDLQNSEYILLVTSNRISRITDYGCRQSGALFGDFATVTVLANSDSQKYPVRFDLIDVCYSRQPVSRAYFDFSKKQNVLVPTPDGGREVLTDRLVFSMDGMGIADTAPRAMAASASELLQANGIAAAEVNRIVPHQAGNGIIRLASMKFEQLGLEAAVVNGFAKQVGNVSSGSVPFALSKLWQELSGYVLCPVAAVGSPGRPEVSQGCLLFKTR
ncbi:MAG: hypothetical protein ISQ09_06970 [Rubripirellula sp.]|nr:hypothetical protein [Rubripirellula sp.]